MLNAVLSNFKVGVKETVSGTFSSMQSISAFFLDLSNKKIPVNYMSLDGAGINLTDGTLKFYSAGDYVGYISDTLSYGDNSVLDVYLTLTSREYQTTNGITIYFWKNYAAELFIEYYKDSTLITSDEYFPDSLIYFCKKQVADWNRIKIVFSRTREPFEYIKLYDIEFGNVVNLNKFSEFNILEEINVISDDLSINTCDLSVHTPEKLLLLEGQEIQIFNNSENFGTFNLYNGKQTAANSYSLKSRDLINRLDNTEFLGTTDFSSSASELIARIANGSGVEIELDSFFNSFKVIGWLPKCSCRYALTQVCWAIGGIIDDSRSDKLSIRPIPTEISSVIKTSDKRIIGNAVFEKVEVVTSAIWEMHNYSEQPTSADKSLFTFSSVNAPDDGNYEEFYFDKPTKINAIYGGNRVVGMQMPGMISIVMDDGDYEFIGSEYIDSVSSVNIYNPDVSRYAKENIKKFDKYTLYGENTLSTELYKYQFKIDQIEKYILSRGKVTAKIVLRGEKVGDLITIETAFSGIITGIITSMNIVSLGYDNIAEIEVLEWQAG